MKKVGEVSKQYDISIRMLRYYEDKGLLKSTRGINNYRYYSESEEDKVQLISLLKKLTFTIKEMKQLIRSNDVHYMMEKLLEKRSSLLKDTEKLLMINQIITTVLYILRTNSIHNVSDFNEHITTKIKERGIRMLMNEEVRIITVQDYEVAVIHHKDVPNPEDMCWNDVIPFVEKHNLSQKGFRHFGYNNPNPDGVQPNYGYMMYITIPENVDVEEPFRKETLKGGLFASIPTTMDKIGMRWEALYQYILSHQEFEMDYESRTWLEECTDYETFIDSSVHFSKKQLDLLLPIKRKIKKRS